MEKVVLTDGESVEIVVAKGWIRIDSDGNTTVDIGTDQVGGSLFSSFEQAEGSQCDALYNQNYRFQVQTKAEKIQQYLHLLFDANRAGHKVNDEIGEALKQYKSELEI